MTDPSNLDLRIDEFDFDLPAELIAQEPLSQRDASRLMVVPAGGAAIRHAMVRDLPDLLSEGDLLVVNNTRVLPARIFACKEQTGGRVELLLLHRDPDGGWTALARPAKSLRPGMRLLAERTGRPDPAIILVEGNFVEGEVAIRFTNRADEDLELIGIAPLPPYIRRPGAALERYQTLYAKIPGSAAAPTAGLHITPELQSELRRREIGWAEVTLHIGLDTFRPMTVERVRDHKIHREWCSLSPDVATSIAETRERGGRIVAIGTTSARTLESWGTFARDNLELGFEGWSDLFITPGYRWKIVDLLLTNFHLPRSTLLMMVSSFAGSDVIRAAYREAIERRYRFYSFGDAMLLAR